MTFFQIMIKFYCKIKILGFSLSTSFTIILFYPHTLCHSHRHAADMLHSTLTESFISKFSGRGCSLFPVLFLSCCCCAFLGIPLSKCLDGDPTTPFLIYPEGYMNDSKAGITWMTQPNLTTNLVWTLASLNHICRRFPLLLILRAENSLGLLFLWIGSLAWWALSLRVPFLLFYFGIKPLLNLTSFSENLDFNFNFLGILFPINLCVSYCFYATCLFLLVWGI